MVDNCATNCLELQSFCARSGQQDRFQQWLDCSAEAPIQCVNGQAVSSDSECNAMGEVCGP